MANEEHLKIIKQGVYAWNVWRQKEPSIKPDLQIASGLEGDQEIAGEYASRRKREMFIEVAVI